MFTNNHSMLASNKKGFTLVELLVVIAIIGILASVVLVSLNSARTRSRDARRIADINQIRTALEAYHLDNTAYPAPAAGNTLPANLLTPTYIGIIPTDPQGGVYNYTTCNTNNNFVLGRALENANDPALDNDIDDPQRPAGCTAVSCGTTAADTIYCVAQ